MVIFNSYFDITRGYTTVHTETFFFSASPNYWWSQSSLTTGCGPIAPRSLFVKPWAWTPRSTQALQGRSGMGRWDTHFLRVLISISIYIYSIYYIHIYIYIHIHIYIYIIYPWCPLWHYDWISHWMRGPRPPFICRFHWISLGQLIAIGKREHTHMVF